MKVKENTQKSGLSAKNVIEPWLIEVHTDHILSFDFKLCNVSRFKENLDTGNFRSNLL